MFFKNLKENNQLWIMIFLIYDGASFHIRIPDSVGVKFKKKLIYIPKVAYFIKIFFRNVQKTTFAIPKQMIVFPAGVI